MRLNRVRARARGRNTPVGQSTPGNLCGGVSSKEGGEYKALKRLVPPKLQGHGQDGGGDVRAVCIADDDGGGAQSHEVLPSGMCPSFGQMLVWSICLVVRH